MVSRSGILHTGSGRKYSTLASILLCGALVACDEAPVDDEVSVRPVRYTRVDTQDVSEARTYSGTARAEVETDLSFRVGGTLVSRPVNVGNELRQGQVVATLDSTDFQVRLDEAMAGLARAEAEQRNASANYERTRDLYENQNATRTQLDAARSMSESADAQHRAATQQVEAARLQLTYATLRAPQQCSVAQTLAEINQNVSPGQPVVRLNCGQCADVVVSVPETDISRISEGMPVAVGVSALSEAPLSGVVKEVGIATGGGSTTYSVAVALEEACEAVRSGMTVDVTFEFAVTGPVGNLVVPYVSVGEDRTGHFVFVIEPGVDGRLFAQKRPVGVGAATADGIVITEGLVVGELIATAGVRRLSAGQEVTLLADPEAGTP